MKKVKNYNLKSFRSFIFIIGHLTLCLSTRAQKTTNDTAGYLNLDQCIVYALQYQPAIIQSSIELSIVRKTNAINLSGWLPQVNLSGSMTHYYQLPVIFSINSPNPSGPLIKGRSGITNTFLPQISATQTIFNPEVLNAARSAHLYVEQAKQSNDSIKINIIADVSKAFYGLLFTLQQMNILREDTARLSKNLSDAYHQNIGGIVDKTDYKEAFISFNNSKAQLKQSEENVRPLYSSLKQLMGFPQEKDFSVSFDTIQMMKEIAFDTTLKLDYKKRIEYQQLQTTKSLEKQAESYYKSTFLPSVSFFFNYVYEYENNNFSNFLTQAYPYSYVGASISIPLFTGAQRVEHLQKARLREQQIECAEISLKSGIFSEYAASLANYKSNLYNLNILKDNVAMAKEVYGVVSLQYNQGVIAYLNVVTAESNLISSEINYLNALFQVLLSKVDLEKAMGMTLSKH